MSKLIFITGASSGIGQAMAWRFYQAGYSLALVARRTQEMEQWVTQRGVTADHADAYALAQSFKRSYKMAGITDPGKQVHVAELYSPFSNTEFHAIEAAGLAGLGQSVATG